MAEEVEIEEEAGKSSKKPMLIGVILALVLAGGGFFATWSGMLLPSPESDESHEEEVINYAELPDVSFVVVPPLVINLGEQSGNRHLRFAAQLEVAKIAAEDVTAMMPRVVDVLNSYLRAVDLADLDSPNALIKLRAQMLRRVQVVTGDGRVKDLLIMEFVLN